MSEHVCEMQWHEGSVRCAICHAPYVPSQEELSGNSFAHCYNVILPEVTHEHH